jgi:hypothetical protein
MQQRIRKTLEQERLEAGRDNKYFEGERGKERKGRGKCPQAGVVIKYKLTVSIE